MSFVAVAVGTTAVAGLATGYLGASAQKDAASAQAQGANAQIEESRRQFDLIQNLFKPYIASGNDALGNMMPYGQAGLAALEQQNALLGLSGTQAKQQAISALESDPYTQYLVNAQENALLQNAAATGGLRGGNTQRALATIRPELLNGLLQQQLGNLSTVAGTGLDVFQNLAKMGQASAAGVGDSGLKTTSQINNAIGNRSTALGNQAEANAQMWNLLPTTASRLTGGIGMKLLGEF